MLLPVLLVLLLVVAGALLLRLLLRLLLLQSLVLLPVPDVFRAVALLVLVMLPLMMLVCLAMMPPLSLPLRAALQPAKLAPVLLVAACCSADCHALASSLKRLLLGVAAVASAKHLVRRYQHYDWASWAVAAARGGWLVLAAPIAHQGGTESRAHASSVAPLAPKSDWLTKVGGTSQTRIEHQMARACVVAAALMYTSMH